MGTVTKNNNTIALPLVYALLSSKESAQYAIVINAIVSACATYHVDDCQPQKFITDFEKAIINACNEVYPNVSLSCCFFHLGQSVYRHVQESGLQVAYNDPNDRSVKTNVHMMLALAFVPVEDVPRVFNLLKCSSPDILNPIFRYFEENYVIGRPGRGRRRAVNPRYPPCTWNQNNAALNGEHRTNNVSEGWHNRFRMLTGKNHPDIYSLIKEFQKEQGDTEISVVELSLGRKVKAAPKKKWVDFQKRIQSITAEYPEYVQRPLDFLTAIAHNIVI